MFSIRKPDQVILKHNCWIESVLVYCKSDDRFSVRLFISVNTNPTPDPPTSTPFLLLWRVIL